LKLFVTGATGLLGRHLVRSAAVAGHDMTILARRPVAELTPFVAGSIAKDIREVQKTDIPRGTDAIVHLATGNDGDRTSICDVAVTGSLAMLRAAAEAGVPRFIHVSSMSVYPGKPTVDEDRIDRRGLERHPDRRGVYAESKVLSETALQDAVKRSAASGMTVDIVRPGLVFDVDMADPLAGTGVWLPGGILLGLGQSTAHVPYLDIEDLSNGLVALLANTGGSAKGTRTFDILSGPPPTKRAFIATYNALTGRARRPVFLPKFVVLSGAVLLDAVFNLRGQPRHIAYKVGRMWDFDPGKLEHGIFWQTIGRKPSHAGRDSISRALTLDRRPSPAASPRARDTARRMQQVVATGNQNVPADPAVVLVGAGRIVEEMHVPAIRSIKNLTVRAIVDPNVSRAKRLAGLLGGVSTFNHLKDVPDDLLEGATAVVATPGSSHAEVTGELLSRGAAILLEKPAVIRREEYKDLRQQAESAGLPVSVFHNYRLRPNVQAFWRFLAEHDVGSLVSGRVIFHSGRVLGEAAKWSHAEKQSRTLLFELAIHCLDIAFAVAGPIRKVQTVARTDRPTTGATLRVAGSFETVDGADLHFELDLSGTSRMAEIVLEFERSAVQLDFFPEGFRVLPVRRDPIADGMAALNQFAGFVGQRLIRTKSRGIARRALPHAYIYHSHFLHGTDSPFAIAALDGTMESLFMLAEHIYDGS